MKNWRSQRLRSILPAVFGMTCASMLPSLAAETPKKEATKNAPVENGNLQDWAKPVQASVKDSLNLKAIDDRHGIKFDETGCEFTVRLQFAMISRTNTSLKIELPPYEGQFDIDLENTDSPYELKNVRQQGGLGLAELSAKYQPFPFDEIKKKVDEELKKTVGPVMDEEHISKAIEPLWRRLNEIAKKHEAKITKAEQQGFKDQTAIASLHVCERCRRFMFMDQADEYLRPLGFNLFKDPKSEQSVEQRLSAIHTIMNSGVGKIPIPGVKDLTADDKSRLRNALLVQLVCRFNPKVDPLDPSKQWFHGQRIAGRATGVPSIRVEGRLNPKEHDSVDWWILDPYSKDDIEFVPVQQDGVLILGPLISGKMARTCVTAKDPDAGPIDYAFELRRRSGTTNGPKVLIQESPERPGLKFPY